MGWSDMQEHDLTTSLVARSRSFHAFQPLLLVLKSAVNGNGIVIDDDDGGHHGYGSPDSGMRCTRSHDQQCSFLDSLDLDAFQMTRPLPIHSRPAVPPHPPRSFS